MERERREQLAAELETIAKTGGADTVQAIKTIAEALVEMIGPSDHERNVEQLRKHGTKTSDMKETAPDESASGLAARGREVSQADLEAEREAKAEGKSVEDTIKADVDKTFEEPAAP